MIGGVLAHALNQRYLRLLAVAAVPIQAARGLYPGYTDRGHLSAGLWAATSVELIVVAIVVLAIRYGRDTGVSAAPAIEFTGVSRWFGDTVALADVSFTAGGA